MLNPSAVAAHAPCGNESACAETTFCSSRFRFVMTLESSAPSEFTDEADAPKNVPDDENDADDSAEGLIGVSLPTIAHQKFAISPTR